MVLTSVIRHMPMLTSHILMVLSLDPDSRKGPGLPLFLVWLGTKKRRKKNQGIKPIQHVGYSLFLLFKLYTFIIIKV